MLYTFAFFNGMTAGMVTFLVASGLTLTFGILRILNFAHGTFVMIGAYVGAAVVASLSASLPSFLLSALVAGLVVGLLGLATDLAIFRRIRDMDEATTLIATFALLLVCEGLVKLVWGLEFRSHMPPGVLLGGVQIAGMFVPAYSIFVVGCGLVTFLALDLFMQRTWMGKKIRAVAADEWMSGLAGINVPVVLTVAVVLAFVLAGLAGGLLLPYQSLSPNLAATYLLPAFVVVIIGGLGNIRGAFVASVLYGVVESLNTALLPSTPGIAIYFVLIAVILWRPGGILTSRERNTVDQAPAHLARAPAIRIPSSWGRVAGVASLVAFASVPLWGSDDVIFVGGLTLIMALFSLSWNFLFSFSGIASFGHAAFFAIGAYLTGYLLRYHPEYSYPGLMLASLVAGGVFAAAVSFVTVGRVTGIALAILTLAVAQIVHIAIGYSTALGADDGLSGIARPRFGIVVLSLDLNDSTAIYLFILAVTAALALALRWLVNSAFGRTIRAISQDAGRAQFIGINVRRYQVAAFTLSGGLSAIAGSLYAPLVQILTPDAAGYLQSTQPMLNSLLGGASFFWGPAVGAVLFNVFNTTLRALPGYSDLLSGIILLGIILLAPSGVLGLSSRMLSRFAGVTTGRSAVIDAEAGAERQ